MPEKRVLAAIPGQAHLIKEDDHTFIDSYDDEKNVRINSRDYQHATASSSAVQTKPNRTATGTGDLTGLEASPRLQAGVGGNGLIAIKADPVLKAGAGNLSGQVVGVEVNLDFGTSGTRTITGDVSAFSTFLAIPSGYTYSGHIAVIRVRDVNIKGWDHFLNLDSASVGFVTVVGGTYSTSDGYITIVIADTVYRIPFFSAVD